MSHFLITGARGGSTQGALAPNRLEINDFIKNEEMFSLYIQALGVMSKSTQEDLISFFQIGGIHGLPYISWDGAGQDDPAEQAGYCTHGSVLFPTWHRPYVALYEQVLHKHAQDIAATYTVDKARWEKAAADLRQPFWDWASNSVPPAEVISLARVTITTPDGKRTQVDNPLFQYAFHPIEPSFPEPYINWQTTFRHPTTLDADAQDNVAELKSTLRSAQTDIRSKTYNLLTRVHTWPAFSNHTRDDGGSSSNSLEAIHDGIHVDVGGDGHMADPAVAGFDPIFFLHHAQVDRLLSLWSALNPGVWVNKSVEEDGTFTIPDGATVDTNTPLTPFWREQSTFWTSAESVGVVPQKLQYSYPEFNGLDLGNQDAVKAHIAQVVNQLYGGASRGKRGFPPVVNFAATSREKEAPVHIESIAAAKPTSSVPVETPIPRAIAAQDDEDETQFTTEAIPSISIASNYWDWTARIHVKKYEVGGSFSVLLFLGAVPESPAEWRKSPHYVGAHQAFVNSSPQRCANCRRQGDLVIEGFVHLNEAIARLSGLHSFDPSVVKPYLHQNLHWRVQKAGGAEVPLNDLPSLEVTVSATRMSHRPSEAFPVPEEPVYHHDVTHGRQGGARTA
ncbi:photo-regulated tyrosinase [Dichomitus squalens LYAD-421 SS1]|uniref:photo-regulated tyrosinase n=1 Tax=Dichomitus squalens (strain LYAD-421) TaxID=732165 RepID=UPI0004411B0A|nr:photo-regulated tyrosinase [Dichomitus squalens LYAD-421 SS1]EJF63238.1 photo-regulated tyrosinase [Dichomitus squalens LYAD-421 SS1]